MARLTSLLPATWLVLAACGHFGNGAGGDDDPRPDAGTNGDVDAADPDGAACTSPTPTVAPVTAPNEEWTWIPTDGMKCADGTQTGIGVNLTSRSDKVLVFFQGGGACWDAFTCFVVQSAAHIEGGYGANHFQSEIAQLAQSYLFQRVPENPLRDVSWIYVPYCTGDLHDGERVASYDWFGTQRKVHHVGGVNADIAIARAAATRPASNPVWLMGVSAGGYGMSLNIETAREAWPCADLRALADCSPMIPIEWSRYGTMKSEWKMRFPAACTDCPTNLAALPAAIRTASGPNDSYGLLAYTQDQVISIVLGVPADQLRNHTLAEQSAMATTNQAGFVLEGNSHVMLTNTTLKTSTNVVLSTWLDQWATADPAWTNAGP
jgi:hypothetical protein